MSLTPTTNLSIIEATVMSYDNQNYDTVFLFFLQLRYDHVHKVVARIRYLEMRCISIETAPSISVGVLLCPIFAYGFFDLGTLYL